MKKFKCRQSATTTGRSIRLAHRHGVHFTKKEEMDVVLDKENEMWDDALHEFNSEGDEYDDEVSG